MCRRTAPWQQAKTNIKDYVPIDKWKKQMVSYLVVSNIFYFHPYLGKIPILTNIFQRGWNHQVVSQFQKRNDSCPLKSRFYYFHHVHVFRSTPKVQLLFTWTVVWRYWQQILQLLEDTWAAIFRCDFCWVAKVAKTNSPMLKDIELKFEQMLRSPRKRSNSVLSDPSGDAPENCSEGQYHVYFCHLWYGWH